MNGATGRGRFADALARLGEPEGERGLVPSWEGRVFTRNGQLKATASDAEVLTVLSGMTYGRGPVGMPLGELAGLRKGIAAGRLRLPGRSVSRSLELVDGMLRASDSVIDADRVEAGRESNRRVGLVLLWVGAVATVGLMWLMLPVFLSILPG